MCDCSIMVVTGEARAEDLMIDTKSQYVYMQRGPRKQRDQSI